MVLFLSIALALARLPAPFLSTYLNGWNLASSNFLTTTSSYAATLAPPSTDKTLGFDGQDDYVDVVPHGSGFGDVDWTMCAWVRSYGVISGKQYLIGNSSRSDLLLDQGGQVTFRYQAGGVYHDATGSRSVTDGAWHHIAAVRSGNAIVLYVDGSRDLTTSTAGALSSLGFKVLGAAINDVGALSTFFKGYLDDVRIYKRALSDNEITTQFNDMPVASTDLLLDYRFNEGGGRLVFNSVSTLYNGTLINGPAWFDRHFTRGPALFYVAPTGSAGGDGSSNSPWNLQTALNHPLTVNDGDTICLRGGTYYGTFTSYLNGASNNPIIVTSCPGEWARLDGSPASRTTVLSAFGSNTRFQKFEITNSDSNRIVNLNSGGRGACIDAFGNYNKYINLTLHDCGQGIVMQNGGVGMEVNGNTIFNNGWSIQAGQTGGHGHGLYIQNSSDIDKIVRHNIVFGNFNNGIDLHTANTQAKNVVIEGNVVFLDRTNLQATGNPTDHLIVRRHYSFMSDTNFLSGTFPLIVEDSYFTNALPFSITRWSGTASFQRNVIINTPGTSGALLTWHLATQQQLSTFNFNNNTYYQGRAAVPGFNLSPGGSYDFSGWQGLGFDQQSTFVYNQQPSSTAIFFEKNDYEAGRANVMVYNWGGLSNVDLQISANNTGLTPGQSFEIKNGQDPLSTPLYQGTYTGGTLTVQLPLSGLSMAQVLGDSAKTRTSTSPSFAVFTVLPTTTTSAQPTPSPTSTPTPTPTPTPIPTPTPTPSPPAGVLLLILEEAGSIPNQAAALESVLLLRDPFSVINRSALLNTRSDRNTRIIVFVLNLQVIQGGTSVPVVVKLIDSNNQSHDITAEEVRWMPNINLSEVVFRLPNNLPPGTCKIRIEVLGHVSNVGTIRIN